MLLAVIPAKAGIHLAASCVADKWVPAFAGTTMGALLLDKCRGARF